MSTYILHNNNWSRKESSVEPKITVLLENMLFIQLKEFPHRSCINYKGENDLYSKEFGRHHINKWQNITNNWAKWYHEPPDTEHNTTYVEFLPKMINSNLILRGKTDKSKLRGYLQKSYFGYFKNMFYESPKRHGTFLD